MPQLPIFDVVDELLLALRSHPQVILQAPPGAGKSTVLPLLILKQTISQPLNVEKTNFSGKILLLEPRRLAARNVAIRLAEQLQEPVGQTIGYRMRSDHCVSPNTRLEVITEGILTRRLQLDPLLQDVSLVILDEFHERSLQTDLALTLLLDIQQGLREDLKILIMSATLDNQALSRFLPNAPLIYSEGRTFPVSREYIPMPANQSVEQVISGLAKQLIEQLIEQQFGSLLVFLPGVAEINKVYQRLSLDIADDIDLCPLYGALPFAQQQQAILPAMAGRKKIVLATNIAETSLTIEGIYAVLDSTLERVAIFDTRTGLTRLATQRISKASMTQRAGRAGRLAPGICWHLVAKEQAERATEQSEAEILHSDLAGLWLDVLNWGCRDIHQLNWLTLPPQPALNSANNLLRQLQIVNLQGLLTSDGKQIAALPCEPRLAAMLVYAKKRDLQRQEAQIQKSQVQISPSLVTAAMLVAIIEEPPKQGNRDLSDLLLDPQSHWLKRAKQLLRLLNVSHVNMQQIDITIVPCLLLAGYPDRIARQRGHSGHDLSCHYLLANGSGASLGHSHPLAMHEWLIVPSLLQSELHSSARILFATAFDPALLQPDFSYLLQESTVIEWHEEQGTLKTVSRQQIGKIIVQQHYLAKPSSEQLKQALLDWVKQQGINRLHWDDKATQLRTRITLANTWLPEHQWPDVSDNYLSDSLTQWLLPSLNGVHDINGLRSVNLSEALGRLLDWQQKKQLDQWLPIRYLLPTGSVATIVYALDRPPLLSVRLQELFGELSSPKIAQERVTVTLELLSPARRPLQITNDLKGFWAGSYQDVKKEMKGRYPKHVWPDDPVNTKPTRHTKKRMSE